MAPQTELSSAVLPSAKPVYTIQPLEDPRWTELAERHPSASAFHTVAWLKALAQTYGYQPIAYTTSPPGAALENALAFCRIASWITGSRLVSLPFSDHCAPLADNPADLDTLLSAAGQTLRHDKLRYLELRPLRPLAELPAAWRTSDAYVFHQLDLSPDLDRLFGNFHKSSTQRKIQRAERDGVVCQTGRSPALLDAFWKLLLITRRRHQVPPQPRQWFENLISCFGDSLQIRVAYHSARPIAAILTLRHKDTLVYKYGCSDTDHNNLGGTQLLFWQAIQDARHKRLKVFDLGRTDSNNGGLITFKDRWGATRSALTYSRLTVTPPAAAVEHHEPRTFGRIARAVLPYVPDRLFALAGNILYKHVG